MKRTVIFVALVTLGAAMPCVAADPQEPAEPPLRFQGYPTAPSFTVAAPKRRSKLPRCIRCHAEMVPDPTVRRLPDAPHTDSISHGKGRVWCLVCHDQQERNYLRTLVGEKLEADQAYLQCGACHALQQKDWYFGAHGKRVETWDGERIIHNCTSCHDPHEPAIEPRDPKPPPQVRLGLQRVEPEIPNHRPRWELPGIAGDEMAHE